MITFPLEVNSSGNFRFFRDGLICDMGVLGETKITSAGAMALRWVVEKTSQLED